MITDTMMKVSRNEALNEMELEEVRKFFEISQLTSDLVASWHNPLSNTIDRKAFSKNPYLDTLVMRGANNTPLSIPNNSITIISWEEVRAKGFMQWDGTNGLSLPQNPGVIGVSGLFEFAVNATGQRGIDIYYYDQNDTVIAGTVMTQLPAQPTNFAEYPVSFGAILNDFAVYAPQVPTKLKIGVYQNSGGALNLTYCQLAFFRMPTLGWA